MAPETNERQPTIVDSGWRREEIADASKATLFDEGWRNRINNNLDPENVTELSYMFKKVTILEQINDTNKN